MIGIDGWMEFRIGVFLASFGGVIVVQLIWSKSKDRNRMYVIHSSN